MSRQDDDADTAIAAMIAAMVGGAVIPAHVNWALAASAMGGGVVAIGRCYGVRLSQDEAWKLVKQFILAAGLTFVGLAVGSKIITAILQTTGFGYAAGVALDAAVCSALAYAVGGAAKEYFKGERNKQKIGEAFRNAFRKKKEEIEDE